MQSTSYSILGLCGNFNGDPSDDYMIRGTDLTTDDVNVFAMSYKTNQK